MRRSAFLDLVRLALAIAVIFSHAFGDGHEPVILGTSVGRWAVRGFFLLSGYLIARSWLGDPSPARFVRRRFARIVPGFVVAFALSVLVVGPILGVQALMIFARDLLGLAEPHTVAGVELNRPMWTIKWELVCYALAPLLLWRKSLFLAAGVIVAALTFHFIGDPESKPGWLLAMFLAFMAGAALAPFDFRFPDVGALPDMSYGTYLYGWPAMLLLERAGFSTAHPLALAAACAPIACVAGYLSHRFIERPCMRALKPRPSDDAHRAPAPQAAAAAAAWAPAASAEGPL